MTARPAPAPFVETLAAQEQFNLTLPVWMALISPQRYHKGTHTFKIQQAPSIMMAEAMNSSDWHNCQAEQHYVTKYTEHHHAGRLVTQHTITVNCHSPIRAVPIINLAADYGDKAFNISVLKMTKVRPPNKGYYPGRNLLEAESASLPPFNLTQLTHTRHTACFTYYFTNNKHQSIRVSIATSNTFSGNLSFMIQTKSTTRYPSRNGYQLRTFETLFIRISVVYAAARLTTYWPVSSGITD